MEKYCYNCDASGTFCLLKLFTLKFEGRPRARFWKSVAEFKTETELFEYCRNIGLDVPHYNQFAVNGQVEYL